MSQPPGNDRLPEPGPLESLPTDAGVNPPPPAGASQLHAGMPRFRSGLLQAAVFSVITVVFWWTFGAILFFAGADRVLLSIVALFLATSASTALLMMVGQQRPLRELGLSFELVALGEFIAGTAGGGLTALCILGTQWVAGWITIEERAADAALAGDPAIASVVSMGAVPLLLRLLAGAAGEELLFRGYGLQQLIRATNPAVAIVGTSALFGLLHGGNPNASNVGLFNTALFGCLFGLLLMWRRSLWTPFGAHFGWNFTLVATGASLSGLRIKIVDFAVVPVGPTLWTGGDYGPEASLLVTIALGLAMIVIMKLPRISDHSVRLWD